MKRFFTLIKTGTALALALCMLFCGAGVYVSALDAPVIENASGAYLYNFENDTELFLQGENTKIYPASTVKLMTAAVALDRLSARLDEKITVTSEMLRNVSGNNIALKNGEEIKIRDALAALIINGANDAAYVLAYTAAGAADDFVKLMNEKAAALGMTATSYTNPTGMHNDLMVTTVYDTAKIAKYMYKTPYFMELAGTSKYVMEATNKSDYRNIFNRNCMISLFYNAGYYYEKASGMNAGSTTEGGFCIAATATDGVSTYLAVVMGAKEDEEKGIYSYLNAKTLFDWAFASYAMREVLSQSKMICEMPVELSQTVDYVTLVPESTLTVYLATDVDIESQVEYKWTTNTDRLTAPVVSGQVVGTVTASYNGEVLGTSNLIVTSDVPQSQFLYVLSKIEKFVKGRFFISAVVAAAVLTAAYIFANAYLIKRGKLRSRRRKL